VPNFDAWSVDVTDGIFKCIHEKHAKVAHSWVIALTNIDSKHFIKERKHNQKHQHVNRERDHILNTDNNELSQQTKGLVHLHKVIGLQNNLQNTETK